MAWTERYVRADAAGGGNGTTDTNSGANGAWTLVEAIANAAAGQRINVRSGTYANTTNTRTTVGVGTALAPIWWRGFATTIGDLDNDVSYTASRPSITFTTGAFIVATSFNWFHNITITGAVTATTGQIRINNTTTNGIWFDNCVLENSGTNANSFCLGLGNTQATALLFTRCKIAASTSATRVLFGGAASTNAEFVDCYLTGGSTAVANHGGRLTFIRCHFKNGNGSGILQSSTTTGAHLYVDGCMFQSLVEGITISGLIVTPIRILNSIFASNTYGIRNTSGGDVGGYVYRIANLFYDNATADESGLADSPSVAMISTSEFPWGTVGYEPDPSGPLVKNGTPGVGSGETVQPGGIGQSFLDIGPYQLRQLWPLGRGMGRGM